MKTVSVKIPDDLRKSLRVIAAKRGITMTKLIQDAVHAYLSTKGKP